LNPRTREPEASVLTTRPAKPSTQGFTTKQKILYQQFYSQTIITLLWSLFARSEVHYRVCASKLCVF
jgi:hypothetical protein